MTWSGRGDETREGRAEQPLDGADWIHLSGADGYLSLAQAKQDAGFRHVGFAVDDLRRFVARLESAGVWHDPAPTSRIGDRVYLNDPEGDPAADTNIELVQYVPGTERSGSIDSFD